MALYGAGEAPHEVSILIVLIYCIMVFANPSNPSATHAIVYSLGTNQNLLSCSPSNSVHYMFPCVQVRNVFQQRSRWTKVSSQWLQAPKQCCRSAGLQLKLGILQRTCYYFFSHFSTTIWQNDNRIQKRYHVRLAALLQGHFQIFFQRKWNPLFQHRLTLVHRLLYAASCYSYVVCVMCTPFFLVRAKSDIQSRKQMWCSSLIILQCCHQFDLQSAKATCIISSIAISTKKSRHASSHMIVCWLAKGMARHALFVVPLFVYSIQSHTIAWAYGTEMITRHQI